MEPAAGRQYKIPVSTLILVHTRALDILLLERADFPDHWQSVTGSQEPGESLRTTAERELAEETGIVAADHGGVIDCGAAVEYEIFPKWRHRYRPGTTHNTEHQFRIEVPASVPLRLAPDEHRQCIWLPWNLAAERVFSWSNREAILRLAREHGLAGPDTASDRT